VIKIKRIYEPVEPSDGYRVLVDRLWPRGVARAGAKLDEWLKDIAPSTELRKWFHHEPERWDEFVKRYQAELQLPSQAEHLERLREITSGRTVTLLYAARNEGRNHAIVVRDMLGG